MMTQQDVLDRIEEIRKDSSLRDPEGDWAKNGCRLIRDRYLNAAKKWVKEHWAAIEMLEVDVIVVPSAYGGIYIEESRRKEGSRCVGFILEWGNIDEEE